ncbi:MAG: hypothetical protein IKB16_10710 [Lentisphaeria bacterium]|nr:hypothetical protein [Lentisphaeria bacterium]
MTLSKKMKQKVFLEIEQLIIKNRKVRAEHKVKLGESAAPTPENINNTNPLLGKVNTDWPALLEPEYSNAANAIREALKELPNDDLKNYPKIPMDKLWLWGGPTPYWGGNMADDALVTAADYFKAENGVYVYGATNEKTLQLHAGFKKLICQVNENCRTPGAQEGSTDEENAERLSKLSLQFPNIIGAVCDDMTTSYLHIVPPEPVQAVHRGLKKYNKNLKLYGVVYAHELMGDKDFSLVSEYFDVVNFWLWHMEDILEYDRYIEMCRKTFPGKPILQGIFLHEYGSSDAGQMPELLIYQLERCRKYLAEGVLEGVVLLGDREIRKWPDSAKAVQEYLLGK